MVDIWNKLPEVVINANSLKSFEKRLDIVKALEKPINSVHIYNFESLRTSKNDNSMQNRHHKDDLDIQD